MSIWMNSVAFIVIITFTISVCLYPQFARLSGQIYAIQCLVSAHMTWIVGPLIRYWLLNCYITPSRLNGPYLY